MFKVLKKNKGMLGLGVDEGTGIEVHGGQFEVFGHSYVAIYDGTHWDGHTLRTRKLRRRDRQFYLLEPGERYDLKERRAISFLNEPDIFLPSSILKGYVGTYHSEEHPQYSIRFFMDDDTLRLVNSWDTAVTYTMFAESEDKLFYRVGRKRFHFERKEGVIAGVTSILDERHYWRRRD